MSVRHAVLAVAVACSACGGSDVPCEGTGPGSVEIGTGESQFETLSDGSTIDIIQGPQGGFHFLGSVRASDIAPGNPDDLSDPNNPVTEFQVRAGGARVDIRAARYNQGLAPAAAGGFEMVGRAVILDIIDDAELDGSEVEFTVEISDVCGNTVSDTRTLTAVPHPANPAR